MSDFSPDPIGEPRREIWFPAKRYGWGWGPPVKWQGWVVFAVYLLLLIGGAPGVILSLSPMAYFAYTLGLTAGLIAICWWKGERPRWRWGDDDEG